MSGVNCRLKGNEKLRTKSIYRIKFTSLNEMIMMKNSTGITDLVESLQTEQRQLIEMASEKGTQAGSQLYRLNVSVSR